MIKRIQITSDPFLPLNSKKPWQEQGLWPCFWVECPGVDKPPFVAAYRLRFSFEEPTEIRFHVTADERYELYIDGELVGRGPERGDLNNWFYDTYQSQFSIGDHVIVARVWSLGEQAAEAQMSVHPGFLLAAEGQWLKKFSTGLAGWESKAIKGYSFLDPGPARWRDARILIDGNDYPWDVEAGECEGWSPVQITEQGVGRWIYWSFYKQHRLQPALLPALLNKTWQKGKIRFVMAPETLDTAQLPILYADHIADETILWEKMIFNCVPIVIPAYTRRRVLLDFEDYLCAYVILKTSGGKGSKVRITWAESLYHTSNPYEHEKGNRNEIDGKYMVGISDQFITDGGDARVFRTLWYQAGRYLELCTETDTEPLTIHSLQLVERRYPMEMESSFECSDERLNAVMPLLVRGLQVDAHDTYFDTPYYEEMMYAGDARLECLGTYILTRDDRLPRKAMRLFDASRLWTGLTQSRYPCRVTQVIPAWSLWWVGMVHDYAYWRGNLQFIRNLLPGMRATLEAFKRYIGVDGLLYGPEGWNILDWVAEWDVRAGIPPDGISGISGPLNWQLVYILGLMSDLEEQIGAREFAGYYKRWAHEMSCLLVEKFWDEKRCLMADDSDHQAFSEHSQALAILSNQLDHEMENHIVQGLLRDPNLARASYHFIHYLIEALYQLDKDNEIIEKLSRWHTDMVVKGLKTPLERIEPSRSDCHAWSSHPLFHYFASVLGIRPSNLGFRSVKIKPQLGTLEWARGRLVHPFGGEIVVELRKMNGDVHGRVFLPNGLSGILNVNRQEHGLIEGEFFF